MFRFVICVDVEADSLDEGYSKLYDTMAKVDQEAFQWESTDEAFTPDGDVVDPKDLQRARMKKTAPCDGEERCTQCGCGLGINLSARTECWNCITKELDAKYKDKS